MAGSRWICCTITLLLPLLVACPRKPTEPPTEGVDVSTVVRWVFGETTRIIRGSRRRDSLGLLLVDTSQTKAAPRPQPGSCETGLRSIHPDPLLPDVVFAADKYGALWRFANGTQTKLVTSVDSPRVDRILGFSYATSPLEMLVLDQDYQKLWVLELANNRVTSSHPVANAQFVTSRSLFFSRYYAARCHSQGTNCLRVISLGRHFSLEREPTLGATLQPLLHLPPDTTDAVYAKRNSTWVYLLTPTVCSQD